MKDLLLMTTKGFTELLSKFSICFDTVRSKIVMSFVIIEIFSVPDT